MLRSRSQVFRVMGHECIHVLVSGRSTPKSDRSITVRRYYTLAIWFNLGRTYGWIDL